MYKSLTTNYATPLQTIAEKSGWVAMIYDPCAPGLDVCPHLHRLFQVVSMQRHSSVLLIGVAIESSYFRLHTSTIINLNTLNMFSVSLLLEVSFGWICALIWLAQMT